MPLLSDFGEYPSNSTFGRKVRALMKKAKIDEGEAARIVWSADAANWRKDGGVLPSMPWELFDNAVEYSKAFMRQLDQSEP